MLALAQPSEGKIVYTKANQQITPNTHYNLDLNNDGITDFVLNNLYTYVNSNSLGGDVEIAHSGSNAEVGFYRKASYFPSASALGAGVKIPAKKKFVKGQRGFAIMAGSGRSSTGGSGGFGTWLNKKNRYLGLKFAIEGQTHYGWARLNVSCASFKCNALLTGYAYETVANKAITTGKTKGPDVITVQEPSLGHLAAGASGIPAWRSAAAK
jgi:hypothetical protein